MLDELPHASNCNVTGEDCQDLSNQPLRGN